MKPATFLLIIGAIVFAFVFGQCRGAANATESAEVKELRATLDSVPGWLEAAKDSAEIRVDTIIRTRTRIVEATAAADSLRGAATEGAAQLRLELPAEFQAKLDTVTANFEAAIDSLMAVVLGHETIERQFTAQLVTERRNIKRLTTTLGETQRQWERALKRNKTCGLGGSFGYGGTLSGGTVHTGPSVTLGISCRVALPFP